MPQNVDRILVTHVGSLVRPPKLVAFSALSKKGRAAYDKTAYEACLKKSIENSRNSRWTRASTSSATASSAGAQLGVLRPLIT